MDNVFPENEIEVETEGEGPIREPDESTPSVEADEKEVLPEIIKVTFDDDGSINHVYTSPGGVNAPDDAIEITEDQHAQMSIGPCKIVKGKFVAANKKDIAKVEARKQINELLSQVTNERLMEAILGVDDDWLKDVYAKIQDLK